MRCESCRTPGADDQCNAWIDCEGPIASAGSVGSYRPDGFDHGAPLDPLIRRVDEICDLLVAKGAFPVELDDRADRCRRCGGPVVAEVGFDEDQPHVEPRRVLVCDCCGGS